MKVPLFDMVAELAPIRAEIDAAIARVLDGGTFIGGPEVAGFERALAAATGAAHAIGVSSGTDALHAIFMALGVGPGTSIVTTPLTFFATAGSAARLGARVIFADIDDDSLCLDPSAALAVVDDTTRAIVPVHLFGRLAAMGDLPPSLVVEDAAQSLGAGGVRGIAAALSFFPTKNVGALGDAGAVITNDATLADRIALLRSHGARPKYHHVAIGGNFRLDALQAAVLATKLRHLDDWTGRRRAHAARYRELLADVPIRLPADDPSHVYHQFSIRAPRRDELRDFLAARDIGTETYYPSPLHLAPCFAELGYGPGSFPIAERACTELLALPIHPTLTVDAQAYVAGAIRAFYQGRSS